MNDGLGVRTRCRPFTAGAFGLRPPCSSLRQATDNSRVVAGGCGQPSVQVFSSTADTAGGLLHGTGLLRGSGRLQAKWRPPAADAPGLRPPVSSLRQTTDNFGDVTGGCGQRVVSGSSAAAVVGAWSPVSVLGLWLGAGGSGRLWATRLSVTALGLRPPVSSVRQGTDKFGVVAGGCGQPGPFGDVRAGGLRPRVRRYGMALTILGRVGLGCGQARCWPPAPGFQLTAYHRRFWLPRGLSS